MFRKVSYTIMVATVFLSWGLMLRVAYSEDQSSGDSRRTASIVNVAPPAYVIPDASPTRAVATSDTNAVDSQLPRVNYKAPATVSHQ